MIHWQAVPFLRFLLFLLLGILLSNQVHITWGWSLICLLLILSLLIVLSILKLPFRYRYLFGLVLSIFFFLFGSLLPKIESSSFARNHFQYHWEQSDLILANVQSTKLTKSGKYQQAIISINGLGSSSQGMHRVRGRSLCYLPADFPISPGMFFMGKGNIQSISGPNNPGDFDFASYLALQDIHQQIRFEPQKLMIIKRPNSTFQQYILNLNTTLHHRISEHFDTVQAGLISALVIGQKSTLEQATKDNFAKVGAMHVLAVSGMHVGIIAMSLGFLFRYLPFRLRQNRWLKAILNISGIWFFALLSGGSASVLRAALMFSLFVISKQFCRNANIWNILAASAFLLTCLWSQSIYMVGFQLSYLALAGIVFFQPRLQNLLPIRNRLLDYTWQLFCLGIAAQIGTAALSIYYFHQFPKFFWLSGIIIVPLATLALLLGVLFLIFGSIPVLGDLLQKILNMLADWMLLSMDTLAKLPASSWDQLYLSATTLSLIYGLLLSLSCWIALRHQKLLWISVFIGSCLLFQQYYNHSLRYQQQYLIAYKERSHTAIELVDGPHSITLIRDQTQLSKLAYSQQNLHGQLGIRKTNYISPPVHTYRIEVPACQLWLNSYHSPMSNKDKIDFLLLNEKTPDSLFHMLPKHPPKLVILAPTIPAKQAKNWEQSLEKEGITVKNLVEETGFIYTI